MQRLPPLCSKSVSAGSAVITEIPRGTRLCGTLNIGGYRRGLPRGKMDANPLFQHGKPSFWIGSAGTRLICVQYRGSLDEKQY